MYNLNYRFDSVSQAGKFSGTALDLIKRYNELAKEAHASGNYVEMEVFRQYAEHYRKIVTEINERKVSNQPSRSEQERAPENGVSQEVNTQEATQSSNETVPQEAITQQPLSLKKKTLKIVEVKEGENGVDMIKQSKRAPKRKTKEETEQAAAV